MDKFVHIHIILFIVLPKNNDSSPSVSTKTEEENAIRGILQK